MQQLNCKALGNLTTLLLGINYHLSMELQYAKREYFTNTWEKPKGLIAIMIVRVIAEITKNLYERNQKCWVSDKKIWLWKKQL